ncbi:hypothetical protein CRUP_029506, partial [Coryphaenoides rupestris]
MPSTVLPASKDDSDGAGQSVDRDRLDFSMGPDLDMELGLDFSLGPDLDVSQRSESSEDEQLLSLQEMLQLTAKPPDHLEPTTPILSRRHAIPTQTLQSTTTTLHCRNNPDQMLKDIRCFKSSKEQEAELLSSCREEDLRKAELEDDEEAISSEQQEFVRRLSAVSSAIRDVHPGEMVFNLERSGRLFSQHSL